MNRNTWIGWWIVGAVLGGVLWTAPARAIQCAPQPLRLPRPYLAVEPWGGFWPAPGSMDVTFPHDALGEFARWERIRRALAERGLHSEREAPSTLLAPGLGGPPPAPRPFLDRESPAFRAGWARATEAARSGSAASVRNILETLDPLTLDGEQAVRRLLFAADVALEDLTGADSLYFRMSWDDAGRTVARLNAWRALKDRDGARAAQALGAIGDPDEGERLTLGFAQWMADPGSPGDPLPSAAPAEGMRRAAWVLLTARRDLLLGRTAMARSALQSLELGGVPGAWDGSFSRMQQLAGLEAGREEPDVAGYRKAAHLYLNGPDADAARALDDWLARWPASRARPQAYLLRGELNLAASRVEDAREDFRVVERLTDDTLLLDRVRLDRAFLIGQSGNASAARDLLNQVLRGPLGRVAEAEIRFDAVRLARLSGDTQGADQGILELEEAFPGEPWAGRARAEKDTPAAWRSPWRSLPSEPGQAMRVEPPLDGPWGELLWGVDFPAREAARIDEEARGVPPEPAYPGYPAPAAPEAAAAPSSQEPMAFLDLGLGVPVAAILGGGVTGTAAGLQYRLDAAKTLAQERHHLPDYRRTDWETGLGRLSGSWRVGVSAGGTARTDDKGPRLGLSPTKTEASWWSVRGDATYQYKEDEGLGFSVATGGGEVDADTLGVWKTNQLWYGVNGAVRVDSTRWELDLRLGNLNQRSFGRPHLRRWFHDLRVARSLSGGWYLGVRASLYQKRVLLMPVAGVEQRLGESHFTAWAGTEPKMSLPSFREVFVSNGDWNVPDLTRPAERRYIDLRGGLRWAWRSQSFALAGNFYKVGEYRTWRRSGPYWHEIGLQDATGFQLTASGKASSQGFGLEGKAVARSVRFRGEQVAYVPRYEGWLDVSYSFRGWRWGAALNGVGGREDEFGVRYADFLRLDLEAAYRFRTHGLPMGFRNLEIALGIQNLTDVEDRRWPGIPAYGFGVVGGVRALYGE